MQFYQVFVVIKNKNLNLLVPYEDTIMSAPWEKEEGNNIVRTYSGPQPGPVQPISSDVNAIDLFLRFFYY